MLDVSNGGTSTQQASSKRLSQIVRGNICTDFTQPCQPLGSGMWGSFGLANIVTSENEFCENLISQDTITAVNSES